jgi:hypothetical protein
MGPALGVGHEGEAELFDVDCTSQLRKQHVTAVNRLLPRGLEVTDVKPLLQGAPSLGKLVAASRFRIGPTPDRQWPETPAGLEPDVGDAILRWSVLADGSLSVDVNVRQQAGPVTSVKQLLLGLGVAEADVGRVRVYREMLVLRPPGTLRAALAIADAASS